MGVEIDVEYVGGLRTRCTHGPSGSVIETTAPKDNEGDGTTFSPTDLCATSLGACLITTMAIAAKRQGLDFPRARVRLEKIMSAEPPRRIVRVPISVTIAAGVPVEKRAALEEIARGCPVQRTLGVEVDTPMTFVWE